MGSYNKRISDQSKIKFDPINRELIDSENSELDARVESLEENMTGAKTATGNSLTVTDAAPVNAVNLSVDLEPIQAGSGTPSPDNIRPISGRTEEVITQKDNPTNPTVTKTYTIQLGQTVYGGQLDVTRGKMVVDKGYAEFDGSSDEDWTKNSSASDNYLYYCSNLTPTHVLNNQTAVTSNLLPTKTTPEVVSQIGISLNSGQFAVFYVNFGNLIGTNDVAHLRTYLASNPLQVVYELATPFTIDLTPQQIKLLENANTITTDYDGDVLSLEYQPNNAFGELLGEVNNIYDSIIEDIYDKIDSLDTRVTALEE